MNKKQLLEKAKQCFKSSTYATCNQMKSDDPNVNYIWGFHKGMPVVAIVAFPIHWQLKFCYKKSDNESMNCTDIKVIDVSNKNLELKDRKIIYEPHFLLLKEFRKIIEVKRPIIASSNVFCFNYGEFRQCFLLKKVNDSIKLTIKKLHKKLVKQAILSDIYIPENIISRYKRLQKLQQSMIDDVEEKKQSIIEEQIEIIKENNCKLRLRIKKLKKKARSRWPYELDNKEELPVMMAHIKGDTKDRLFQKKIFPLIEKIYRLQDDRINNKVEIKVLRKFGIHNNYIFMRVESDIKFKKKIKFDGLEGWKLIICRDVADLKNSASPSKYTSYFYYTGTKNFSHAKFINYFRSQKKYNIGLMVPELWNGLRLRDNIKKGYLG